MVETASLGTWLAAGGWQIASNALLVPLLVGAAWVDVREHRIPNKLIFPGVVLALLLAHLPGGSVSNAFTGMAIGMGMSLPLYWLRAMGAGDVKLLGMVGGFVGGSDMFAATLVIFVVGGVLGLIAVVRRRAATQLATNLKDLAVGGVLSSMAGSGHGFLAPARTVGVQPYAVAIAAGTVLYLAFVKHGDLFS